ncbi:glycerol kinase 1 isoform X1 [Arctopsyche grandis]|uniref:glycerol kinase 1 isoform X1 n=1 Tax=Arctopsyche grandis TaxID=121162 RepID=UPI00406D7252
MSMGPLVGAIDEGTSSARFILFKVGSSEIITSHQIDLSYMSPQEGWLEQDPVEIVNVVNQCIEQACINLEKLGGQVKDIVGIGITNQRETTVLWDKNTGRPLYNAILWSDMRTTTTVNSLLSSIPLNRDKDLNCDQDYLKSICGLPLISYFSAVKIRWMIDSVPEVKQAILDDTCLFGTIDTWLMWNLLDKVHVTDVSNASRTMLMNIMTMEWDDSLLRFFNIPKSLLPEIKSSAEVYGHITDGPLQSIPISGCVGDQQAALVGQRCLREGEAKSTYGTGCFILYNTGPTPYFSSHGLLTTVAYQIGAKGKPIYALEGSAAVAGSAFDWLRDNLQIIVDVAESQVMAENVSEHGSCVFVPAFSGLFAPYWQHDARGVICGMTEDTEAGHIVRATMEAICYQVKDIILAMNKDCGITVKNLKVDGGVTANSLLMQMQANLGGFSVTKGGLAQSTAFGAALVAQWGVGLGDEKSNLIVKDGETFLPRLTKELREKKYDEWKLAISKSQNWTTNN